MRGPGRHTPGRLYFKHKLYNRCMHKPLSEKIKPFLRRSVLIILGLAIGIGVGLIRNDSKPAQIAATPPAQPVKQQSTHIDERTYVNNHLDFRMEVPLEWLHRYSTVDNGGSVSFAFQTAVSPGGTTRLEFSDIFTIYRYGIAQFDPGTCGCTELGRSDKVVFGYKMDGTNVPLVTPLTPALIKKALTETVAGTFTANQ